MQQYRQAEKLIFSHPIVVGLLRTVGRVFGMVRPEPPQEKIPDHQLLARMQCNVRGTLLTLLRKERLGDLLSRVEWRFLANMSYQTYDSAFHKIEAVDRDLIAHNILAFAAVIKLRDEQYPHLRNQVSDGYYRGNMNFSWIRRDADAKGLQAFVHAGVEGFPQFPSSGCGSFPSRNLDVSLRSEPELDQIRLNQVLQPFLRSILLVCLYGYWTKTGEAILTDRDRPDGRRKTDVELSMENIVTLDATSNRHFHLSAHGTETTIGVAITPLQHQYVFALNDYVELIGFSSMLMRISSENNQATMPGFEFGAVPPYTKSDSQRFILGSGRWRHFFSREEFEALKDVLEKFAAAPTNAAHLKKLESIYGRI